ncbi:MAG: sigma-70 family RNA polymerase sigma factor [Clostridia bacterium]|nr:sigma-70 family RNA polymerase sigma factor [Clostridia bacterium]
MEDKLYKNYSMLVYNYLYSLSKDRELAEELTQETFYKAIKNIKKFEGNSKVSTWLCQIAKNEWRTYVAKESKIKQIPIEDENYIDKLILENTAETEVEEKEAVLNLYKEIHKLDQKTKEVIYLRIKGDLSFKEIGEILGESEEWARITYYRGKIKLKEELRNDKKRM